MRLSTFSFDPKRRWSINQFPDLDSENSLVMVFGASDYINNSSALSELAQAYPRSIFTGCSSAGEIAGTNVSDNGLSIAVMRFEYSQIRFVSVKIDVKSESQRTGIQLAQQLNEKNLRSVFVLSDGLSVNGSELVKGINSIISHDVVVTGGLAGDGDRFQKTWVMNNLRHPENNLVTAVGFYGNRLQVGYGSQGGWNNFGLERRVTHSEGNVLYELDGKPALALYQDYLGELASGLPATGLLFPLSIRNDTADARELVRTVRSINTVEQSMTFAGDIPKGYLARLMRANFDQLVNGARLAANQANNMHKAYGPTLSVAISCVGRRLLLGERIEEETEIALKHLPDNTQQVGFYSYGEISPYANGACELHNQTMTLTTFAEV